MQLPATPTGYRCFQNFQLLTFLLQVTSLELLGPAQHTSVLPSSHTTVYTASPIYVAGVECHPLLICLYIESFLLHFSTMRFFLWLATTIAWLEGRPRSPSTESAVSQRRSSPQTPLNTSTSIVFARDMRDLLLPNISPPYRTRQYRHAELPIRPTILRLFGSLPTY